MQSDAELGSISTDFVFDIFHRAVALHAPIPAEEHDDSDCEMTDDEEIYPHQYVAAVVGSKVLEPALGDDLSVYLGKNPARKSKFDRFQDPRGNIQSAVEELRVAAAARRISAQRSWMAAFKFTRRFSKKPQFERFSKPSSDIGTAVEAMRDALGAKRASKQRSWVASFKFTGRLGTKPHYERFSQGGSDLAMRVEAMRLAAAAKRSRRTRSWATNISWAKQSTKKPMFERFATPLGNISTAVQLMRQQLAKKRDVIKLLGKENFENQVLIEDVNEEDESATASPNASPPSGEIKMLMPPPSFEQIHESVMLSLASFEHEMLKAPPGVVSQLRLSANTTAQRRDRPRPLNAPAVLKPTEPISFECSSAVCTSLAEVDTSFEGLEAELLTTSERCAQALDAFEKEATLYVAMQQAAAEETAEIQRLLKEEEQLQESTNMEIERLIEEESNTSPSSDTMAKWVAGSPARAARQMRRSAPTSFRMDALDQLGEKARESSITRCYAGLGVEMYRLDTADAKEEFSVASCQSDIAGLGGSASSKCSAMALDLGLAPLESPSRLLYKSARPLSMGNGKMVQSTPSLQQIRPLSVSKSSGSLTKLTLKKLGGDSHAWNLEPLCTPIHKSASPYSWSTVASRGNRSGNRYGF